MSTELQIQIQKVESAVLGSIAAMKNAASERGLSGWIAIKINWATNKFEVSKGMEKETSKPAMLQTVEDQVGVFELEVGFFNNLSNHLVDTEIANIGLAVLIDHLKK